jgi:hypothetical protein
VSRLVVSAAKTNFSEADVDALQSLSKIRGRSLALAPLPGMLVVLMVRKLSYECGADFANREI